MSQFQVDPALKDAIAKNVEELQLCDESGMVVGYAITPKELVQMRKAKQAIDQIYSEADIWSKPENVRRVLESTRWYTTEEVLKGSGLE